MLDMDFDPDLFRVKVGQYGDRWYLDPMPPDGKYRLEQMVDPVPSVSTIKKAAGKDWTQVSLQRVAKWWHETQTSFEGMEADQIAQRLQEASGAGLDVAAERGTQIHRMMEVYAVGGDPTEVELGIEAQVYRNTVLRMLRDLRPVVALSEFVCFSTDAGGYAGTADALWCIDGDYYVVDYKTRANKHAVYLEEGWQVAAYGKADYCVGEISENVVGRFALSDVGWIAGGLIVSITPTGYNLRGIDLDAGYDGFRRLAALAESKRAGIGPVFDKKWRGEAPPINRDAWVRDRINAVLALPDGRESLLALWPEYIPTPKKTPVYDDNQIEVLLEALETAEARVGAMWPQPDPGGPPKATEIPRRAEEPLPPKPAEGDPMPGAVAVIKQRYERLTKVQVEWTGLVAAEAAAAGVPIHLEGHPTARRVFIARALILAAENKHATDTFEGILDSILELVDPNDSLGAKVGSLTWEQASVFAALIGMAHPDQPEMPKVQAVPAARKKAASAARKTKPNQT